MTSKSKLRVLSTDSTLLFTAVLIENSRYHTNAEIIKVQVRVGYYEMQQFLPIKTEGCDVCRRRAEVIDGRAMARQIQDEVKVEVERWVAGGARRPHLTAVLVGDDPASAVYVRNKMRAAKYTGQYL